MTLDDRMMIYLSMHFDHMHCWLVIIRAEIVLKNKNDSINNHVVKIGGETERCDKDSIPIYPSFSPFNRFTRHFSLSSITKTIQNIIDGQ